MNWWRGSKENVVSLWHVKSPPPLGPVCFLYGLSPAIIPESHPLSDPLINIVGPRSKADACGWIWEYSDSGTCLRVLWPTWWCVFWLSCQPDTDGCTLETYLEFELCPSSRSPLAPCLTSPQGTHPKNKGAHVPVCTYKQRQGCKISQLIKCSWCFCSCA